MMTMLSTMRMTCFFLRRVRIIGVASVVALLLGGCSVLRFTYNQADEILYWWLDGYTDFDTAQSAAAREAIARWLGWHRRTQLPDYAGQLARARQDVLAPITAEAACRWFALGRERAEAALAEALPALADHVMTMTPAQWRHVEQRFAKGLDEMRADYLQADRAERQRATVKRAVERFEMLYGRLDDAQRDIVAQAVAASPFDAQRWLEERQARQRDVLATLPPLAAERTGRERVLAELRRLSAQSLRSPREGYRAYQQRLTDYNCAFFARVHNATTTEQRSAAAARLKGWEDDVRALAAAAPALAPAVSDPR
jgi:uncharacterized coiled-coil protein SlyX